MIALRIRSPRAEQPAPKPPPTLPPIGPTPAVYHRRRQVKLPTARGWPGATDKHLRRRLRRLRRRHIHRRHPRWRRRRLILEHQAQPLDCGLQDSSRKLSTGLLTVHTGVEDKPTFN